MSAQDGSVSFIEMGSGNVETTAPFFVAPFGWSFHPMEDRGGWFDTPGGKVGLHGGDADWGMVPYLKVGDIESAARQVRRLGGDAEAIVQEDGFGRFCNCRDPQGMRFGLHQPPETR